MLRERTAPHFSVWYFILDVRVKQWKTVRANACKNRTINLNSKNTYSFKFHRLLNLSSGNSMFSINIVFCLMLVSWDFVHSDEVPSQRDKIRQIFSFLDQLDSFDSHLPTSLANTNSVKSDNLLAAITTVGNNRPNMPHHSRAHPNNWRLYNRYYEDGSKTYNYDNKIPWRK